MEAGNRCYDDRVPEEVNRRVIDHSSDILMPYTERSRQNLLREGIQVRDLVTILEGLIDYARVTKNVDVLTEYVRHSLSDTIARIYRDVRGIIHAIAMDPRLEQTIALGLRQSPTEVSLVLEPSLARHITDALSKFVQQLLAAGHPPVVLCSPQIRLPFRLFFESAFADLAVIAYSEIPPRVEIQNAATISSAA